MYSLIKGTEKLVIFEVGCGVGNFMFPLLEEEENIYFYACDFSKRAVDMVKVSHSLIVIRLCSFIMYFCSALFC